MGRDPARRGRFDTVTIADMRKPRHPTEELYRLLDGLDDASLRALAGEKTFTRGVEYVAQQRVSFVAELEDGAAFDVDGEQRYRTTLFVDSVGIEAECTCPSAKTTAFCKHAVAAALYWRTRFGGEAPEPAPRSAKADQAAATRAAKRERVRTFIAAQPAADLAARLWARAERDASLMAELKAWEASTRANDDPKALRQAVGELVADSRSRVLYGREVVAWATRARMVEPLLRRTLVHSPEDAREAAEYALRRVYGAAQHMDDSGGEVGGMIELIVDVIIDALKAAPPASSWASRLLRLLEEDPYGIVEPDRLLDAAGADCARAFARVVADRWDTLELAANAPERDHNRTFLRKLMLTCLRRDGGGTALFDFMKRTARGMFEHAELIRWCDRHGRHREAIQLARAACREFRDHRLVEDLLLAAYERDGWDAEAFAIHERRFATTAEVRDYPALLAAAARVSRDVETVRAWAYDAVEKSEAKLASETPMRRRAGSGGRIVSRTVELLLHDNKQEEALALVQPPNLCDMALLERIAARLPISRNAAAFELLDRTLHAEMESAQTPYHQALHIVALARARLGEDEALAYLARLQGQYKAKRNFVSALPALLGTARVERGGPVSRGG